MTGSNLGWLDNIEASDTTLGIDGREVCVEMDGDELTVRTADGDDVLGTAEMVLLDEPVFSDGPYVYGTVEADNMDAEIEWNLMARMFGNDMINVVHNGRTFEVKDAVRTEQWDYQEGDPVEDAMTGIVTPEGVGVILPDKSAEIEDRSSTTEDDESSEEAVEA